MRKAKIKVIGAGSLGSFACWFLVKMGFEGIEVYDHDTVESHNQYNQIYRQEDVGKPKVVALPEIVNQLTGGKIETHMAKAGKETPFEGIVITMVDSMAARKEIFEAVKYNPKVKLFIDARSGAPDGTIYAINPADPDGVTQYEETLYLDEEAENIACSDQTTLPLVWIIDATVAQMVRMWSQGWVPSGCAIILVGCKDLPKVDNHQASL